MSSEDQKLRSLVEELAEEVDHPSERLDAASISQVLEEISDRADEAMATLDVRNSEALLGQAPSSEAALDPATVEVQIGEAPDDHMPEAAVVMPKRTRRDAGKFKAQPPPLPDTARRRRQTPTKPPKPEPTARTFSPTDDLRPIDALPDRRWNLSQTPLRNVLLELVTQPGVGLLELRSGHRRAQLIVEDGQVFEIRLLPASPKRSLLALLVRGGRLSQQKAGEVQSYARRHKISQAQALLSMPELVSPEVVRAGICSRLRYLLRRLLDANLAHAEYFDLEESPSALMFVSIPMVGSIFSHVRGRHTGKYSGSRGRAAAKFRGMQLVRKISLAFSVNQLGLKLHERQLIDRVLQKPRPFEKVVALSPLPDNQTIAMLAALEDIGLLEMHGQGLSAPSSSWAEEYAEAIARIETMEARLERENYFSLLGLHWATYDAEIERRYQELHQEFETLNQPLGLNAKERLRLRMVRKRIKQCYEVLSDPHERKTYRNRLVSAGTRRRAAKKLEALGSAALRRKMFHSALDYIQRLLEIAPDNKKASRLLPILLARTSRSRR